MNKVQVVEAVIRGVGEAMNRLDGEARREGTDPKVFAEGLLDGLTNCLAIVATNAVYKYPTPGRQPAAGDMDATMGRFYDGIKNATMALMRAERERIGSDGDARS